MHSYLSILQVYFQCINFIRKINSTEEIHIYFSKLIK